MPTGTVCVSQHCVKRKSERRDRGLRSGEEAGRNDNGVGRDDAVDSEEEQSVAFLSSRDDRTKNRRKRIGTVPKEPSKTARSRKGQGQTRVNGAKQNKRATDSVSVCGRREIHCGRPSLRTFRRLK